MKHFVPHILLLIGYIICILTFIFADVLFGFPFDPNTVSDPNFLAQIADAMSAPRVVQPEPDKPFNVIGIPNSLIVDVNDLTVEVLMLTDGKLYLLNNPEVDFNKSVLPSGRTVKTGNIRRFFPPQEVWSELSRGLNTVKASQADDPDSFWYDVFSQDVPFTSWQLTAIDYMGTGRSWGIGIDGQFYSVSIEVEGTGCFSLEFPEADINHDGCVNMEDFEYYSAQWMKKVKVNDGK